MTLKEITKMIDKDTLVCTEIEGKKTFAPVDIKVTNWTEYFKRNMDEVFKKSGVVMLYKFNPETAEMTLLAKIDHRDKKVFKKKLGDMSDKEIEKFKHEECRHYVECFGCPLYAGKEYHDHSSCCEAFIYDRKYYLEFKDKEIEVEVSE
jgi:hypothetical protein